MNFNDLKNSNLNRAQQTVASLQSFREYLDSFKNKLIRWSSYTNEDAEYDTSAMSIAVPDATRGTVLAVVTAKQYNEALDGTVDSIDLKLNESGSIVTVSSETLINAIENVANDASIQSTFISECLDNTEVKVDSFITKVRNVNTGITGAKIEEYSSLLKSGDPVQSLQSLFSTVKLASATKTVDPATSNEYISLASATDFTGANILTVAWENLWGTVTSFFDVTWEGITKIGSFISKIFDGLINCVKWLVKLVMKPLTTRFEKGNASIGMMDLPLLQVQLCKVVRDGVYYRFDNNLPTWINDWIEYWEESAIRTDHGSDFRAFPINNLGVSVPSDKCLNVSEYTNDGRYVEYITMLLSASIEFVDGVGYYRPYDVIIPSSNGYFDMLARIGISELEGSDYLTLMIYPLIPYSSISSLTDGEIYSNLQNSCVGMIRTIANQFPCSYSNPHLTDVIAYWLSTNTDGDNVDIVAHNYAFDFFTGARVHAGQHVSYVNQFCGWWFSFMLNGLLPYLCFMGPSYQYVIDNYNPAYPSIPFWNNKNDLLETFLCGSTYYHADSGSESITYYNSWPDTLDVIDYRPYVQYNLYGVSVHYQTLDEAANELLKYIIVIVIAAAAVFISVKWNKFKKKRANLAEIRQGYVDNMAWNLPQNPTAAQLKEYQKAKKKALKTNKLNNLLGISTPSDSSNSIMSSIFSIRDQMLSMQGVTEETPTTTPNTVTLEQIRALIRPR